MDLGGHLRAIFDFFLLAPIIIVALTIHEYAHARVAFLLGDPTAAERGRMTLNPLAHLDPIGTIAMLFAPIGWAKPVPVTLHRLPHGYLDFGLVAAAGPAANLLLAAVSALLLWILSPILGVQTDLAGNPGFESTSWEGLVGFLLFCSVFFNVALACFNLLPVPPLDGSNLLRAFLPPAWAHSMGRFTRYGAAGIVALVLLGQVSEFQPLLGFLHLTARPIVHLLTGYYPL